MRGRGRMRGRRARSANWAAHARVDVDANLREVGAWHVEASANLREVGSRLVEAGANLGEGGASLDEVSSWLVEVGP
jgi:hypothetical protein